MAGASEDLLVAGIDQVDAPAESALDEVADDDRAERSRPIAGTDHAHGSGQEKALEPVAGILDHHGPGRVDESDGARSHPTEVNPITRFQQPGVEKNAPLV
jgi:hypothetical protein